MDELKKSEAPPVSSRSFVKYAGMSAAAAAAVRPAWSRVIGANDPINLAVIGLGLRGNDHMHLLLDHRRNKQDIEVVALCGSAAVLSWAASYIAASRERIPS